MSAETDMSGQQQAISRSPDTRRGTPQTSSRTPGGREGGGGQKRQERLSEVCDAKPTTNAAEFQFFPPSTASRAIKSPAAYLASSDVYVYLCIHI